MRLPIFALTVLAIIGLADHRSLADEMMVPLAASGDWAAMAHRESMMAPPDMCLIMNVVQGFAIRAQDNSYEVRVIDKKWSLPPHVEGKVLLAIGGWSADFDIVDNTDTMVSAAVSSDALAGIFGRMDKASSMQLTVGKAKARTISLSGSSKATNAFRTCAGIQSNDQKGGENPFK